MKKFKREFVIAIYSPSKYNRKPSDAWCLARCGYYDFETAYNDMKEFEKENPSECYIVAITNFYENWWNDPAMVR